MGPVGDPGGDRLNIRQFADVLGAPYKAFAARVARGAVVAHDGRNPTTGRRWWYRATAEAFRDARDRVVRQLTTAPPDAPSGPDLTDTARDE